MAGQTRGPHQRRYRPSAECRSLLGRRARMHGHAPRQPVVRRKPRGLDATCVRSSVRSSTPSSKPRPVSWHIGIRTPGREHSRRRRATARRPTTSSIARARMQPGFRASACPRFCERKPMATGPSRSRLVSVAPPRRRPTVCGNDIAGRRPRSLRRTGRKAHGRHCNFDGRSWSSCRHSSFEGNMARHAAPDAGCRVT